MMQLFRPEALRAQDRLYGDVQLTPPVSWQILGYFLFATVTAVAIYLSLASYTYATVVEGRIVAAQPDDPATSSVSSKSIGPVDTRLEAALDVPADVAGEIAPGQRVRIAIDAFPATTFGAIDARLLDMSPTTMPVTGNDGRRRDVFIATATLPRATIAGYGHAQPLRPGMTVSARIETGRRSLIGWLFDPMPPVAAR